VGGSQRATGEPSAGFRKAARVSFQDGSPYNGERVEVCKREDIKVYKNTFHLSASTC
jgi:hypothetical protein